MTGFDVTADRHHTAVRVDYDTWRDSVIDLLTNATTEDLYDLREWAAQAEDVDLSEDKQDAARAGFDAALHELFGREVDVPRPAVYVDHAETDVFLATVQDAAVRGALMGVPPFNVACPECGALPGVRCVWRERNWVVGAAHIKRHQAAKPATRRGAA